MGGGATGVEIAGALSEMKRYVIPYDYPDMDSSLMHIYLLEAGDRLLAGMSQDSSKKAYDFLTRMGVDVQFGKMVTDYKNHKVLMKDGQEIPTRTFLWVSGVKAQPITGIEGDHLGRGFRIVVDEFNRIPGMDGLFAIGDQCIQTTDPAYPGGHPQLAQVAIQQATLSVQRLQGSMGIFNSNAATEPGSWQPSEETRLCGRTAKFTIEPLPGVVVICLRSCPRQNKIMMCYSAGSEYKL